MDVQVIARIMQANKLSDVMVGALLTGKFGAEVQAGPKQISALTDRGFLDRETGTLTDLGVLVVSALEGKELSEETQDLLFPAPKGDQYYVTEGNSIRPFSEAPEGTLSLSWAAAKTQIIADATTRRRANVARNKVEAELIKATRSLRKEDLNKPVYTEGTEEVDTED